MSPIYEKIYALVRQIPKGKVATYGQIAEMAGIPQQARRVGYALSALGENSNVPWQRVINAKGEISERAFADKQRILLKEEGIVFVNNTIDLIKFQWQDVRNGHDRSLQQ